MWGSGYIRRRVTRNLGRGAPPTPSKSNPIPDQQIHSPPPNLYQVADEHGAVWVDKAYINTGLREGWLKLDGWFFHAYDGKEHMVYVYVLK